MIGKWQPQKFTGVYLLDPFHAGDPRGEFVKTFHIGQVADVGLQFELREEFYSVSHANVIRGMHFQVPPHAHQKIVYCIGGSIVDVLVDLRKNEPTYREAISLELSAAGRQVLWIPIGIAHGFRSLEDNTCVVYKTDHEYAPESDTGIRWDSIGFDWGSEEAIVSDRDRAFATLKEYNSPF
ncbi:dTDP-4-dehydrorhamnose 3,5-epimerase family protein [Crateriforma spongiae]|uniref:dTDP-4-dehydrorhamnose 3,5-epimerase family protein n=1 Tax=Crateriforma spongiae TaxID=2724528 RepID=UPI001448809C|nr:dTDP-4-dehydrorhamnose 3,5-epimerase family protein [Crateriforma spongiae]